jgi:XTP/dITP diphosphohydrolase
VSERVLHVGTTNPGKVQELAALLAPLGVGLRVVASATEIPEPSVSASDGFLENARAKALAYSRLSGGVTLSEDSGLAVAALGGLPGIWSARFADLDPATRTLAPSGRSREEIDPLNSARVLEMLAGVAQPRRAACFKIAVVLAKDGAEIFHVAGESHGWIAEAPRGDRGFGYDPIFVGQDSFGRTYAELDPMRKNLRSHRKQAMDQLFFWLSGHLEVFA